MKRTIPHTLLAIRSLIPDNMAVKVPALYPEWDDKTKYSAGNKVHVGDKLFKCKKDHTSQPNWKPGLTGTESLWGVIDETHSGSAEDPIPYNGNMILEKGKFYIQSNVRYKCIRSTGNPVYHPLSALVGQFVEIM